MTTAPRCPSSSGSAFAIAAAARRSTLYVPVRYRLIVFVKPSRVAGEPSRWTTFSAMPQPPCATTRRGDASAGGVSVFLGVALGTIVALVNRDQVNDLRHHLTLWLVLTIVAGINIIAFLLFTIGWIVYRWIRRDLEVSADEP